jgi:hypothetical protein
MYPEYRKKIEQIASPRPNVFNVQFEQEHKKQAANSTEAKP